MNKIPETATVAATVIKNRPLQERRGSKEEIDARAKMDKYVRDCQKLNFEFRTLAEKIAKSSVFIEDVTIQEFVDAFPFRFMDWTVSQKFPFAAGGPLYVDHAGFEFNIEVCRQKAAIMRKLGLRYLWLEHDDTLETAEKKISGELK